MKKRHVTYIVKQLIETNMLVSELFTFFSSADSSCFNVPDGNRSLFLLDFDSGFLEDTFEQGRLPPAQSLPNSMAANQLLQFNFSALLNKEIGKRKNH